MQLTETKGLKRYLKKFFHGPKASSEPCPVIPSQKRQHTYMYTLTAMTTNRGYPKSLLPNKMKAPCRAPWRASTAVQKGQHPHSIQTLPVYPNAASLDNSTACVCFWRSMGSLHRRFAEMLAGHTASKLLARGCSSIRWYKQLKLLMYRYRGLHPEECNATIPVENYQHPC